jgi:hypothetical protein
MKSPLGKRLLWIALALCAVASTPQVSDPIRDWWHETRIVVMNASDQKITDMTFSVPGAEISFRGLEAGDFTSTKIKRGFPSADWQGNVSGHLADGTPIKGNVIRGNDERGFSRIVYAVKPDGQVWTNRATHIATMEMSQPKVNVRYLDSH